MIRIFTILSLCLVTVFAQAQILPPPDPPRLVVDMGKVLSPEDSARLEDKLRAYRDSTSTEIVVVTVPNLNGYEVNDFAYRIGKDWKVGQEGKNNGLVVLVSIEDHKAAIATGYGMEGAITDASTRRIRQDYMSPNFRKGDFYAGLDQATTVIMKLASGEFTNENFGKSSKKGRNIVSLLFVLAIIVFPILSSIGRARRNHFGSKGVDFWTAFWLMSHMGGGRHGNDSWGGGGGSDFGGFGGGSFGGGGSGGDW